LICAGFPGLGNIAVGNSGVRLGARVCWRDIEDDQRLEIAHPLLLEAIAPRPRTIRSATAATVGGSLAHADPAAELPGIAVTCDAEITLVCTAGTRTICASEFFTGPLSTARQPAEIITELHLPFLAQGAALGLPGIRSAAGRFALAGIALFYDEDHGGRVHNAHVGVIGACHRPQRLTEVETLLNGHPVDEGLIRQAAANCGASCRSA